MKIQDKLFANAKDKEKVNLIFKGNCKKSPYQASACQAVIKTQEWKGIADAIIQDAPALLEDSTIMCTYGGAPIKITDDLQVSELTELSPTDVAGIAPVMPMNILIKSNFILGGEIPIASIDPYSNGEDENAKIVKGWWTDNNDKEIKKAIIGHKVRFHIETKNMGEGENLNLTLRDWDSWINYDDKLEGVPESMTINNNKGYIEFTIPKKWEDDIEEDYEEDIELYFDVEYKGKTYEFPEDTDDYLKVSKEARVVVFFIGGAADKESYYTYGPSNIVKKEVAIPFENQIKSNKEYGKYYYQYYLDYSDASDDKDDTIYNRIEDYKDDVSIYIVGHSLGGWNGAHLSSILSKKGYKVKMLITLDPVGEGALVYIGSSIYYSKPKPKADFWINIRCTSHYLT